MKTTILNLFALVIFSIPMLLFSQSEPSSREINKLLVKEKPNQNEWQLIMDAYGRIWHGTNGKFDLSPLDAFYAPDSDIVIYDMPGLNGHRSWAKQKEFIMEEFFSNAISNTYVPRQNLELKYVGENVAIVNFLFDIKNITKDGNVFETAARQTNVWEYREGRWYIVHEHGSVPLSVR